MKGYLQKTEGCWLVLYDQRTMQDPSAEDGVLPLYFNNDRELVLDNKQNLNFYSGKEVEFEIVNLEDDKYGIGLTYAKLIRQEKNKSDVEKLAEDVYGKGVNYDYEEGFVDGYNKAKEYFYTKQDLIDLVDSLKYYTKESHTILGHDDREPSEFVDIFLNEISDEEIEEQSWGYREVTKDMEIPPNEDWSNGAKWYREQLKKKL